MASTGLQSASPIPTAAAAAAATAAALPPPIAPPPAMPMAPSDIKGSLLGPLLPGGGGGGTPSGPGIKVKIKRTSSTDSRSSGSSGGKESHPKDIHEIVPQQPKMANGKAAKAAATANGNGAVAPANQANVKKDKLKLNVVESSLSDNSGQAAPGSIQQQQAPSSLSSSLDSPLAPSTPSAAPLSSSSSSACSSPVVGGGEPSFPPASGGQKFNPESSGVLKRHLLGQNVEPPSKKTKVGKPASLLI